MSINGLNSHSPPLIKNKTKEASIQCSSPSSFPKKSLISLRDPYTTVYKQRICSQDHLNDHLSIMRNPPIIKLKRKITNTRGNGPFFDIPMYVPYKIIKGNRHWAETQSLKIKENQTKRYLQFPLLSHQHNYKLLTKTSSSKLMKPIYTTSTYDINANICLTPRLKDNSTDEFEGIKFSNLMLSYYLKK